VVLYESSELKGVATQGVSSYSGGWSYSTAVVHSQKNMGCQHLSCKVHGGTFKVLREKKQITFISSLEVKLVKPSRL